MCKINDKNDDKIKDIDTVVNFAFVLFAWKIGRIPTHCFDVNPQSSVLNILSLFKQSSSCYTPTNETVEMAEVTMLRLQSGAYAAVDCSQDPTKHSDKTKKIRRGWDSNPRGETPMD